MMMISDATPVEECTLATSGDVSLMDKVRIEEVLDMVRPYLQADGGNVELVDVTSEGVVMVRLQGACGTCPSSTYTLKMGIEEQLKHHIPGIKEVISV
jgi:Fe-S cluster biogenesis protein NfuA